VTDNQLHLSDKELARRAIIRSLNMGELTPTEAADQLGIGHRQLRVLRHRYRAHGDAGLIDRRRLSVGNHRVPKKVRAAVIDLVRAKYVGRSCAEIWRQLRKIHDIRINQQTLRNWLRAENLVKCRKRRSNKSVDTQPAAMHHSKAPRQLRFALPRRLLRRPKPTYQGPSMALMTALKNAQVATNELVLLAELEFAAHKLIAAVGLASKVLRHLPSMMLHEAKVRRFHS